MSVSFVLGGVTPAAADEPSGGYWVGGRILEEWAEIGRPWAATSPELAASRNGRFQQFGANSIYWHDLVSNSHANQIGGDIRTAWGARGWENGNLMYPTTRELPATGGAFNNFEGGSIYWSPSSGAHQIGGLIRDKWGSMDWERSPLHFPTSDEFVAGSGAGAGEHFQGGSIYWTPSTGAHPVWGDIKNQWAAAGWENGKFGFPTSDEYDDLGGKVQRFQNGIIAWNTKHVTVEEHLWGWTITADKYITDKIGGGWLEGIGGASLLMAIALGISETNPVPALVAAIAAVAAAGVALCRTPDEGTTFYMTRQIGMPSTISCNPFAGRSAGTDEGFEVTDFENSSWPDDGTVEIPSTDGVTIPETGVTTIETSLPPAPSSSTSAPESPAAPSITVPPSTSHPASGDASQTTTTIPPAPTSSSTSPTTSTVTSTTITSTAAAQN